MNDKVWFVLKSSCVSIETEPGLRGLLGLPAAPAAVLAFKFVSAPAATRPLVMAAECVWGRIARRGTTNVHLSLLWIDFKSRGKKIWLVAKRPSCQISLMARQPVRHILKWSHNDGDNRWILRRYEVRGRSKWKNKWGTERREDSRTTNRHAVRLILE